jgi:DNA-binding NarL/FixJ family response regulator
MRIIIADDHSIVRRGLKEILIEEFPFAKIDEAENADDLIKHVLKEEYDLVLTDLTMPGRSGFESMEFIRKHYPRLPILVLSVHSEEQYAIRVLKAGAAGYLNKDLAPEELIQAVQTVLSGRKYITQATAEKLADAFDYSNKLPHEHLSDREFEVLKMIATGKSISEIAETLSLSSTTVSTFRSRILRKMNISSNAGLVQYVIEHKLI